MGVVHCRVCRGNWSWVVSVISSESREDWVGGGARGPCLSLVSGWMSVQFI